MVARQKKSGDGIQLDKYPEKALARVWKAQRFSRWMTTMLHTSLESLAYDQKLQDTDLAHLISSAENYVGVRF